MYREAPVIARTVDGTATQNGARPNSSGASGVNVTSFWGTGSDRQHGVSIFRLRDFRQGMVIYVNPWKAKIAKK